MCLIMCLWYNRLEFYLSILKAILWAWWVFAFSFHILVRILKVVFFHCYFKWFSISNHFNPNLWCFGAEMEWGRVNGLDSNSVYTCRPLHVVTNSIHCCYSILMWSYEMQSQFLDLVKCLSFIRFCLRITWFLSVLKQNLLFFVNVALLLSAHICGVWQSRFLLILSPISLFWLNLRVHFNVASVIV